MNFPAFNDAELNATILRIASTRRIARDQPILRTGQEVTAIPVLLSGSVRVLREDEKGDAIFLYHLSPGQTCAMTLACCQSGRTSRILAVAEDDCELMMIPVASAGLIYNHPEWQRFINASYDQRFDELIDVIDVIAFRQMDEQLVHYLEKRAAASSSRQLHITHQQIANELHTHREVVSRLLRTMERKGMVTLGRNVVTLN
jgi:CRP/FNR family transcriptional regulator, anaerobic regulatory protein